MFSKYFELWRYAFFLRRRLAALEAQPSRPAAWRRVLLRRAKGNAQYTVVSACYNVAAYLPDYFDSLIGQRLDFRNNIHVICVDDGSTDDTAAVIRRYAERYPENITYIRKENGGQAEARNLGFRHVRTPWVCFIDPDDFVDYNCFYEADRHIAQHPRAALVSMNVVFYREESRRFALGHPLAYKYKKNCTARPINRMGDYLQLFTNSALFRTDVIRDNGLEGDSRIKPSFEDAHFVARYLLMVQDKEALFLKNAKYYYRKRSNGTSTLDGKYKRKALFRDIVEYGYRDILRRYADAGISHDYVKRLFIYDILFLLRECMEEPARMSLLSQEEKEAYFSLLRDCFAFYTTEELERIHINGFNWFWKLAAMRFFRREETDVALAVPVRYDTTEHKICLRLFCAAENPQISAISGEREMPDVEDDKRLYDLADVPFMEEHILHLPLTDEAPLQVFCNGKPVAFCLWRSYRADGGVCDPKSQTLPWLPGKGDFLVNAAGARITHYFAPAAEHDLTLTLDGIRREWGKLISETPSRYIPAALFGKEQHLLDSPAK